MTTLTWAIFGQSSTALKPHYLRKIQKIYERSRKSTKDPENFDAQLLSSPSCRKDLIFTKLQRKLKKFIVMPA